ncbi:MAG: outer membrane protein assembly factor BamD [Pseudomonadota bacterium]|nr:outer membrane protein assembly factor BamD [Pseudomonadota bacterium]
MTILFYKYRHYMNLLCAIMLLSALCGCKESKASKGNQSEEVLVYKARKQLSDGKYQAAIEPLTQLSNNYQISSNAQLYKLELMHSEYRSGNYKAAIESADQFFTLYPYEPNSDYALYIKTKASLKEFHAQHWLPRVAREKYGYANSEILKDGIVSANLLITNYPKSKYADETMELKSQMREILLKRDYSIAQHYRRSHAYVASQRRLADVIVNTSSKKLLRRALEMTKANYLSMQQPEEAQTIENLIQENWGK